VHSAGRPDTVEASSAVGEAAHPSAASLQSVARMSSWVKWCALYRRIVWLSRGTVCRAVFAADMIPAIDS